MTISQKRKTEAIRVMTSIFALGLTLLTAQAHAACEVVELFSSQLNNEYKAVGKIKAGAHSFTSRCNRNQVIDDLKSEACELGANAIVVTRVKKPGAWRSCFTIEATAYVRSIASTAKVFDQKSIKQAAQNGDTEAQFLLGESLLKESGEEESVIEAYAWLNLAASQNHSEAVGLRNSLEGMLSWSELAVAQNRAYELWLEYYEVFGHLMDTSK